MSNITTISIPCSKSVRRRCVALTSVCIMAAAAATGPATAQSRDAANPLVDTPAGMAPDTSDRQGFWGRTGAGLETIWSGKERDLYVPGFIWHLPWKYSAEQRGTYNAIAWGGGFARS